MSEPTIGKIEETKPTERAEPADHIEPTEQPAFVERAEEQAESFQTADSESELAPAEVAPASEIEARTENEPKTGYPPSFKSGFAALIGRPNAGKSTLLNALVGEHIAAVSNKPQTTRTRIRGIVNRPEGQIVFVDTPGIHKPGYTLNRRMMGFVSDALLQVDIVLLMRDVTQPFGQGEKFTLELVKQAQKPSFLLLNKIDKLKDKKQLLPIIEDYRREYEFAEIIPLSALTGDNQDVLVKLLLDHLPTGEPHFDTELFTDEFERNIAAEIVREKILEVTGDEIPYVTAVRTEMWQEAEDGVTEINCVIYVERTSQKPILIGKQGSMLKQVGTRARKDIRKLLDRPVRLFLFVRVQEQWRNDPRLLDELGIEDIKK
jgi:GTP-binding protein Era